jgi:adenylyl cyclase-associated protein
VPYHPTLFPLCRACMLPVQVKGKCNAISIDKCHKTGVVFEDVIATCEMVNCSSVQVQCTGSSPTVSVDKCDGVQVYIPAVLSTDPNFQVRSTACSHCPRQSCLPQVSRADPASWGG